MLTITHPPTRIPEREYVLQVIFKDWLGLDYIAKEADVSCWQITMAGDSRGRRLEIDDSFLAMPAHSWMTTSALPRTIDSWQPAESENGAVAVLYGNEVEGGTYESADGDVVRLRVDLLGSTFFMLTRYEEVVNTRRDEFERFAARFSLLSAAGLIERPIVNEWVELLWTRLQRLWPRLTRKTRAYRFVLSCDVDNVDIMGSRLRLAARIMAGRSVRDAFRDGPWHSAPARALRLWHAWRGRPGADALDDFDFLMDLAEQDGGRFVFNLIAADGQRSDKDGVYDITHRGIRRLMRRISDRHHELGFHGSYDSIREPERIRQEFSHLRQIAAEEGIAQPEWGGRQHYLRWEAPVTWRAYASAGLAYDSSLTFADHAGFRCGTCYDFPVFDLSARTVLPLRERPLVVMEATLLGEKYMKLDLRQAAEKVEALSRVCRRFNGDFTFLWHNGQSQTSAKRTLLLDCAKAAWSAAPLNAAAAT